MAYHRVHGVDTRIVRIFNTYGPRMRVQDGRAIPTFLGQALRGEAVTVFGDGSQTRSFCYVVDLVDGIYRLMMSDAPDPVNIGNPRPRSARSPSDAWLAGSKLAASSNGPCPWTIRRCAEPDITRQDAARLGAESLAGGGPAPDARLLRAQARRLQSPFAAAVARWPGRRTGPSSR